MSDYLDNALGTAANVYTDNSDSSPSPNPENNSVTAVNIVGSSHFYQLLVTLFI